MRIAAVTTVFNEAVLLPIWLKHYGESLGYQHLYVIDDGSDDGSTDDARIVNLIRCPRGELDESYRARLVSRFHAALLGHYDVVMFIDADELIVVDPDIAGSLPDYLRSKRFDFINPIGFNVLHRQEREPPINLSKPLFTQRKYVKYTPLYSKPAIAAVKMEWLPGFHQCTFQPKYDRNLLLFHLRMMDVGLAKQRLQVLHRVRRSEHSRKRGYSFHYEMPEAEYLRNHLPSEGEFRQAGEADMDLYALGIEASPEKSLIRVPDRFRRSVLLNAAGSRPRETSSVAQTAGLDGGTLHALFEEAAGWAAAQGSP